MDISRRTLITTGLTLGVGLLARSSGADDKPIVTVYKSPT